MLGTYSVDWCYHHVVNEVRKDIVVDGNMLMLVVKHVTVDGNIHVL